jgi:superoxide dismutase
MAVVRKNSSFPPPIVLGDAAGPAHTHARFILSRGSVGHINHSLFWTNLEPSASESKGHGGTLRDGPLKTAVLERWGSLDALKKEFNTTTAGIQGSGWGWLVCHNARLAERRGFNGADIDIGSSGL